MFEVSVQQGFRATHRLRGDFGPATQPHGHAYQVQVTVRGPSLAADGTLVDVGLLQELLAGVLAPLDQQDLNTLAIFNGQNTTAEVLARHLFAVLQGGLAEAGPRAPGAAALRVTVWESADVSASYEGSLGEPGRG